MNVEIEISVESDIWLTHKKINKKLFSEVTKDIVSRYPNFSIVKEIELSILLTDNTKMLALNSEFRGVEKPTNVLSFQDLEVSWQELLEFKPDPAYVYLGDVAFGYEKIISESNQKEISFEDHFKHLLVHSVLHLIGYDHITEEEANIMENLEIEILKNYDIKSPYEIRK